eukprot:s301_g7.t1
MKKNNLDFTEIKVYYQEITVSNFDSIKRLKEDYASIKKDENDDAKKMYDLEQRTCLGNEMSSPFSSDGLSE